MRKLFNKNMLITSLLILIPITLLIIITYSVSTNLVLKNIYDINNNLTKKISGNVENHINWAINIADELSKDKTVQNFTIRNPKKLTYNEIMQAVELSAQLKSYQRSSNAATDFEIYYLKEEYCIKSIGSGFLINKEGVLVNWDNVSLESIDVKESRFELIGTNLFYLAKNNINEITSNILIAAKISNISIENIIKIYTDSKFLLLDKNDHIIFKDRFFEDYELNLSEKIESIYDSTKETVTFGRNKYIVTTSDLTGLDFKCIVFVPLAEYYKDFRKVNRTILLLIICSIVGVVVLSYFISLQLLRPMESIISIIKNNETESLSISDDARLLEIEHIASNIIQYKNDNKRLSRELLSRIDIARRAQMYALQAQINPHFLYNTLDSINWDAMQLTKSENPVSKNIQLLSQLMRTGLEGAIMLVPLKEELEHAKLYLELYKNCTSRSFNVRYDIDPQTETIQVVKLTLQPIVENAINHGLKPLDFEGEIVISSKKIEEKLVITISDNGVGIENDVLEELNGTLNHDTLILNEHIGLGNVNLRLKLFFGSNFGVHIESKISRGTSVVITLPAETKKG